MVNVEKICNISSNLPCYAQYIQYIIKMTTYKYFHFLMLLVFSEIKYLITLLISPNISRFIIQKYYSVNSIIYMTYVLLMSLIRPFKR